ncbi:MAG TPA: hypothetical protein VK146_01910 [Tabrizicola sp.]|nr:hypothetical protein [Tabrizicola sp.]
MKRLEPVWDEDLQEDVAWRLENLNDWLKFADTAQASALQFDRRAWTPPRESWEHEHCEGCWAKFVEHGEGTVRSHGWLRVGSPDVEELDEWICDNCHRLLGLALNGNLRLSWVDR